MRFIYLLLIIYSSSVFSFDHTFTEWSKILKEYTLVKKKQVYVDYKSLKKKQKVLDNFLISMENLDKKTFDSFSDKQKLAFWINAYNAYTLKLILKNYPVKSIKDIGWFFSTPWKIDFIKLFGKVMSLDDIEHGIIRKEYKEARVHFALNCASIGCPSLFQEAFIATKIDTQLEICTKNFLLNTRKNVMSKKVFYVSKVFDWFEEDFVKYHGSVQNFIGTTLNIQDAEQKELKYIKYDWSLNELSAPKN